METYAFGDVQGCFRELRALIKKIGVQPTDVLWFAGDLVNRGPASLDVLRYVSDLGKRAKIVLGNHDLHLLRHACGQHRGHVPDPLQPILDAPDRDHLLAWLRQQPLLLRNETWTMVHAGLLPEWSIEEAMRLAEALSQELQTIPNQVPKSPFLDVFTRLRYVHHDGTPAWDFDGPPNEAPRGFVPWFAHPNRQTTEQAIVFGHWAALGYHVGPQILCLDSGCVWGGSLTAVRLQDGKRTSVPAGTC